MKLLHLGLILLVGVLIIKAVDAYNKEGFDFVKADVDQKKHLKMRILTAHFICGPKMSPSRRGENLTVPLLFL